MGRDIGNRCFLVFCLDQVYLVCIPAALYLYTALDRVYPGCQCFDFLAKRILSGLQAAETFYTALSNKYTVLVVF